VAASFLIIEVHFLQATEDFDELRFGSSAGV